MKWLGEHIWSFVSRFRNKLVIEDRAIQNATAAEKIVLIRGSHGEVKQRTGCCEKGVSKINTTLPITGGPILEEQEGTIGINNATSTAAGAMPATDFVKLAGIETGATRNVGEVKEVKGTAPVSVDSTDPEKPIVEIATASSTTTGVMTSGDFTKLAGIQAGATRNVGEVKEVKGTAPVSVDATDPEKPVVSVNDASRTATGLMTKTEFIKLDGIAANADVTPSWVPSTNPNYSTATGVANNADVTPSWVPAKDPVYLTAATQAINSIATAGTSGPATLNKGRLNIPDYTPSGYSGSFQVVSNIVKGQPTFVTITVINGVIQTVK
tara:strand:- start:2046 stop:3020 length:975 start_codon:yes stop_codon:yes gene_type:complete